MTILNAQVSADDDDARENLLTGAMDTSYTAILVNNNALCATRFQLTGIQSGDTINSATLDVYIYDSTYDNANIDITAEDIDNSPQPTTTDYDLSDRTQTTALVNWDENNTNTGWQTSPDISTIIQEVIDRAGWSSGNYLTILWLRQGDNFRFRSHDHTPSLAAKLDIDYTAGGDGNPVARSISLNPYINTYPNRS